MPFYHFTPSPHHTDFRFTPVTSPLQVRFRDDIYSPLHNSVIYECSEQNSTRRTQTRGGHATTLYISPRRSDNLNREGSLGYRLSNGSLFPSKSWNTILAVLSIPHHQPEPTFLLKVMVSLTIVTRHLLWLARILIQSYRASQQLDQNLTICLRTVIYPHRKSARSTPIVRGLPGCQLVTDM
jgi:hypothetical protein